MFAWLENLLIKAPIVGSSCPCCEGQKQQLKRMQKALLQGELEENVTGNCSEMGACSCQKHSYEGCANQPKVLINDEDSLRATYHYQI